MSGGDLDGDQYLVIWHKELIEKYSAKIRKIRPASYKHEIASSVKQTQHHQKTDWKTYIALWENKILAEIDSCFYELAEEFGVDSKECQELCEIFSRAVDNIPSDVKRLREISSRCSPSSKSSSSSRNSSGKPIWDKLTVRRLELLEKLREEKQNNRFPDSGDWKVFYNSLVYRNEADLIHVLFSPLVQQVLGVETMHLKIDWSRILKERPINL